MISKEEFIMRSIFFIKFILLLILIAGCSSSSNVEKDVADSKSADENKDITIGYYVDISNYDPIKGSSGSDHALLWPVYDTLISFNSEMEPEPGLAESWDIKDDTTIILHLREGVEFHDGTPF